jgi:hypothetical protein
VCLEVFLEEKKLGEPGSDLYGKICFFPREGTLLSSMPTIPFSLCESTWKRFISLDLIENSEMLKDRKRKVESYGNTRIVTRGRR